MLKKLLMACVAMCPLSPEDVVNMNFTDNELLDTVNIPSTVTSLGSMAFSYCPSLVEIVISATVTEIDSDAALFSFSKLKRLVLEGKYADYRWMRPNKWRPAAGGVYLRVMPDGRAAKVRL